MHVSLWRWIERISWWLENPDERQTVLGDIQERGASLAAFFDLIRLILLRQLRAWKSWRTWLLGAALVMQFRMLLSTPLIWSAAPHHGWLGGWPNDNTLIMYIQSTVEMFILTYAIGFSLGALGKRTVLTIIPILALFPLIRFSDQIHNVFTRQFLNWGYTPIVMFLASLVILVVLPLGWSLHHSLRGVRMNRWAVIGIGLLFCALRGYSLILPLRFEPQRFPLILLYGLFLDWPLFYTLIPAIFPRRRTIPVPASL